MHRLDGATTAAARQLSSHLAGIRAHVEAPTRDLMLAMLALQLAVLSLAFSLVTLEQRAALQACEEAVCAGDSARTSGVLSAAATARRDPPQTGAPDPEPEPGPEPAGPGDAEEGANGGGSTEAAPADDGQDERDEGDRTAAASAPRPDDVEGAAPAEKDATARAAAAAKQPTKRRMSHRYYAEHAAELIDAVPTLEALQQQLPPSVLTRDLHAQRAHISWLDAEAEVTLEGFESLTVDTRWNRAFADLPDYRERIQPKLFIVHWTAVGYDDVGHFVSSLRPYRVQYFLDRQARVFELFEADDHKPAHGLGINDFSQGVEIETGPYDGSESPLFSYTPDQIEQTVYLAVDFLRRNGLRVDETTLLGHYAADLIFTNPHYRPHAGTFMQPRVRKFDPPQELMRVIVAKAQALDAALDA